MIPLTRTRTGNNVIGFRTFVRRRYGMDGKRVLVVDDEEDVALYFATLLESHGFVPSCSFTAEEALRSIRVDPPDVIVLDVMMPGRGGLNLFAELKGNETYRRIPVVIVTGIDSKTGCDFASFVKKLRVRIPEGYVQKPVDPERFVQTVCTAMTQGAAAQ